MNYPDDVPDFPFPKPKELESLEKFPLDVINGMKRVEIIERIRNAAISLATAYMRHTPPEKANYEECFSIVSSALKEMGSSIPGQLGSLMVGTGEKAAEDACRDFFPDDTLRHG